tara:strand:- start:725 stop:1369 length:645 start_codon:yes stop_codon:yes gene_type:complete
MILLFGINQQDTLNIAQIALDESISQITDSQGKCTSELQDIVQQVKQIHANHRAKVPVNLLQRSKSLRETLSVLSKKRNALENHKEQIETSKLNQTLLNSMKQTNNAMKSLGVNVSDADNIMLDLEEASTELGQLQSTLASNTNDDVDDTELEQELELMLSENAMSLNSFSTRKQKQNTALHEQDSTNNSAKIQNNNNDTENEVTVEVAHSEPV